MSSSQTASKADHCKAEPSTSSELSSATPRSTIQPSSIIPAKRTREQATASTTRVAKIACGADIVMNVEKLPPLPAIAPDLAHVVYAEYETQVARQHRSTTSSPELVACRRTWQRQQLVGSSVAKVFVVHWLVNCHPAITAHDATPFTHVLLSNAVFCRLAIAYSMEEKIAAQNPGNQSTMRGDPKSRVKRLANAYEAYLGLVFRDVMIGKKPWTGLWDYFSQLLTPEVFTDLENRLQLAIEASLAGQPVSRDKQGAANATWHSNPPARQSKPSHAQAGQVNETSGSAPKIVHPVQQKHCPTQVASPSLPPSLDGPVLYGEELSIHELPTELQQHMMRTATQTACKAAGSSRADGLPVLPCRQIMTRSTQQDVERYSKAARTSSLGQEERSDEPLITSRGSQPREPAIATGSIFTTYSLGVDTRLKHSTNVSTQTDATINSDEEPVLDNLRSALSASATLLRGFELDSDLVIMPRTWLEDAIRLLREKPGN